MNDLLSLFRSSTGKIKAALESVQGDLAARRNRYDDLCKLPLPPNEQADFLMQMLERRSDDFFLKHMHGLHGRITGLLNRSWQAGPPSANASLLSNYSQPSTYELEGIMVHFFRDALRAGLEKAAAEACPQFGPPRAEREKELAKLDAEISALEGKEKDLLAQLQTLKRELEI